MLKYLENTRLGIFESTYFTHLESTRRSYMLELSKYRDIEQVFGGGVNTLDIEDVEGKYLLSGTANGGIFIHDLENLTGKPNYTCRVSCSVHRNSRYAHKFSVETVQWYPRDTGMFISSGMDRKLKVWDTNNMKPADNYTMSGLIYQHNMSPIATKHCLIAVACSSSNVSLVDLKTGSSTHELRGHRSDVLSVKWSTRNEHLLATGGKDNRILLWDVRSSRSFLKVLDQHGGSADTSSEQMATAHSGSVNGLCFSHDGLYLISYGTDNRVRLWNTFTGKMEIVNYGKVFNESRRGIRFDVSRTTLHDLIYVPSNDKVFVYVLQTGAKIGKLLGHFNAVNCCVVHPFYQELYSGANDRNVLVWTSDSEQCRAMDEEMKEGNKSTNFLTKRGHVNADSWSDDDS